MEKRIVIFGLLSLAIMLGFAQLQLLMFGRPEPVPVAVQDDLVNDGQALDAAAVDALAVGDGDPADPNREAASDADADQTNAVDPAQSADSDSPAANVDAGDPTPQVDQPERRVALGSLDVTSNYQMLVTVTSVGAAIERVELTNPRYRDLNDNSGYLGHLAGTDDPAGGVRVGVVGQGTPAATATCPGKSPGLQGPLFATDAEGLTTMTRQGDRIVSLNDELVTNQQELQLTAKTKPGETVTLAIQRPNAAGAETRLNFTATLGKRPLEIIRPEPLGPDEEKAHPLSFLTTMARIGDRAIALGEDEIKGLPSLHKANWATKVDDANGSVEFSRRLSSAELQAIGVTGSFELVKRFSLLPSSGEVESKDGTGYIIDFDFEIRNTSDTPQLVAYQLDGPTGLPMEGWWYSTKVHPTKWGAAGARDVIWRPAGKKRYLISCGQITKQAKEEPENPESLLIDSVEPVPMHFVGCDAQYFAAVLMPRKLCVPAPDESQTDLWFDSAVARPVGALDLERSKRTDVSFRARSTPTMIAPGEALTQNLAIFAGPKERNVLDQFGIGDCIVYGWFGQVSRPLVGFLHFLYRIVGNYGIAIILLTVTVRGAMFPLGRKMALNAQKMQELGPEMKKIADKYKNDMEKRSKAQRELFAKHNYNPLAGCFMMFFQLPVFLGLYRGLSTDIHLRQAALIPGLSWCSNLAGPDNFLDWSGWMPTVLSAKTGWLGPHMNILPFVTCVLFMLHQKLFTPPPTDEQQQMQQSIMKVMMLFMGVMFHKVAAGLCIYFIASSLWGLAERLLLPKSKLALAGGAASGTSAITTKTGATGSNGHASPKRKKKAKKKR